MTSNPRIYLSSPHMSGRELEYIEEAFASNWVAPLGPHVDAFEKEFADYLGLEHAAALSSGTAALHLAVKLLGIGENDEVICPTFTFCSTANALFYERATPVFIDSEEASWNIDPDLLEEELHSCKSKGKLPRAVIAVDLYGQCADYDRIQEICSRYEVALIEDAAEGLGATYKGRNAGTFGVFGAFSFNGNKIITTSGGGMLVSRDAEMIQQARFLATQARDPAPHYQHSQIGFNYRLSNVLAGIGRAQLKVLSDRVQSRRNNYQTYYNALSQLPGLRFMPEALYGSCTRWLTCITIDPVAFGADTHKIRVALEAENIEARPLWKPLHVQPVFKDCRIRGGKVAEALFNQGLCLPSGSNLTPTDLGRIIDVVRKCARV